MKANVSSMWMLLIAFGTIVSTTLGHGGCGTVPDKDYLEEQTKKYQETRARSLSRSSSTSLRSQTTTVCIGCISIELVFHVIGNAAQTTKADTMGTDDNLAQQLQVLNEHYKLTPFQFVLKETKRINSNDEWAFATALSGGSITTTALTISGSLRVGGPTVANVYISDGTCNSDSFASFPSFRGVFPENTYSRNDYIFLCPDVISFGEDAMSQTVLTHELGHWFGLFHTFAGTGACDASNPNDLVADTPIQSSTIDYCTDCCETGRDSCPNLEGTDPVTNFMEYSLCSTEFTSGQMERMYDQYMEYRDPTVSCNDDEMKIRFELQYDNNPQETVLGVVTWGQAGAVGRGEFLQPNFSAESHIDFRNQLTTHELCLATNSLYEVRLQDANQNGIAAPGFFKVYMNGDTEVPMAQAALNPGTASYFVAGDKSQCASAEKRFQLELGFDGFPSTITWNLQQKITADDGSVSFVPVVDSSSTYTFGGSSYFGNLQGQTLLFDHCLEAGDYVFSFSDSFSSPGDTGAPAGYFSLKTDGGEFYRINGGLPSSDSVDFTIIKPIIPGFGGCFPGRSTVQVQSRGTVALEQVQLGDLVLVDDKNKYEPIYSFGHHLPDSRNVFLRMEFEQKSSALELTKDHLIFCKDKGAIPAAFVVVGDKVVDGLGQERIVKSIQTVKAQGLYAPFTPSGSIVVDGILVSSFVGLVHDDAPYLSVFGWQISYHWLSQSFQFPHRLVCRCFGGCFQESYTKDGISTWAAAPRAMAGWILNQHWMIRDTCLVVVSLWLVVFNAAEFALSRHGASLVAAVLFLMGMSRRMTIRAKVLRPATK